MLDDRDPLDSINGGGTDARDAFEGIPHVPLARAARHPVHGKACCRNRIHGDTPVG